MSGAKRQDGLPIERYFGLDGESSTSIRDFIVSPLLHNWRKNHDRPDRDTLRLGRAGHTAVLEPHRFADEYVVYPERRQSKAWDAFKLEHEAQGKTILTKAEHAAAIALARAVHAYPLAAAILEEPGQAEVTITWRHQRTGLLMKSRIDWLSSMLVELKTCHDPSPRVFGATAWRLGYATQMAVYESALVELGIGPLPARIIAVQKVEPWDVVVYHVPEDVLLVGEQRYETALDQIAACRDRGEWPGVAGDAELVLKLPAYATSDGDEEITFGGAPLSAEGW